MEEEDAGTEWMLQTSQHLYTHAALKSNIECDRQKDGEIGQRGGRDRAERR